MPKIAPVLELAAQVPTLGAVYSDEDFAVLRFGDHNRLLHADHTYSSHPLLELTGDGTPRGVGIELWVYGVDPDLKKL